MTPSAARIAANRANSLKSTGPRTLAGKRRASRNSAKHGLTIAVVPNASVAEQIDTIARMLVGDDADTVSLAAAHQVAEIEVNLIRIRHERARVVCSDPGPALAEDLRLIDRYFNRCRAKRKRALHALDALRMSVNNDGEEQLL